MKPKTYRLVCFDLDGTLIALNDGLAYWSTLHQTLQDPEEGTRFEKKWMGKFDRGEITYKEWLDADLGEYRKLGMIKADFERAARKHRLIPGVKETILELHRRGYKLAIISGSLNILIDTLFPAHPFDDVFVNKIFFNKEGKIEGWKETVYDQGTKHKALHAICKREDIRIEETVFVGDGENDIDILQEAGLGIAFCPESEKVTAAADVVIRKCDLASILTHLG